MTNLYGGLVYSTQCTQPRNLVIERLSSVRDKLLLTGKVIPLGETFETMFTKLNIVETHLSNLGER